MKTIDIKFLLFGIILLLPQVVLNSISSGLVLTQKWEKVGEDKEDNLTLGRITALKITNIVNLGLDILTSILTLLKVSKNL